MINITENISEKNIGKTSLFITFDYKPEIVDIIKQAENAIYNKTTKTWELPLNKLSFLINNLTYIDDISLYFLDDKVDQKNKLLISNTYKTKPFDYQKEGIEWLINNQNGLLLDPPGLGKTIQIIYAAEELKRQKGIEHCLIICGINTLKTNWKLEINKHSTLDCIIIGEKINSKGNTVYASVKDRAQQLYNKIDEFFVIINVESLRDNTVIDAIRNSKNNFDMIVVDEVHKCLDYNSLVDTNKGKIKIGDIVENKLYYNNLCALSYNETKKCYEYSPITDAYKNFTEKLVELEIEESGKLYKLKCTPDHLIYTARGWVQAQYLNEYDDIKII